MCVSAEERLSKVLENDPELGDRIIAVQSAVTELNDYSLTTVLLVLAHIGHDTLLTNPNMLFGSAITEQVR